MARRNVLADIGQLTPCLPPPLFSLNTIGGHCFTFYTILHYRSCSHNRWTFSAIVSRSGSAFQQFPRHMAAALYSPSIYHEYERNERTNSRLAPATNLTCREDKPLLLALDFPRIPKTPGSEPTTQHQDKTDSLSEFRIKENRCKGGGGEGK